MRYINGNIEREAVTQSQCEHLEVQGFRPLEAAGILQSSQEAGLQETQGRQLGQLNTAQLRAIAKERGIEGAGSFTKAELLTVLKDVC